MDPTEAFVLNKYSDKAGILSLKSMVKMFLNLRRKHVISIQFSQCAENKLGWGLMCLHLVPI